MAVGGLVVRALGGGSASTIPLLIRRGLNAAAVLNPGDEVQVITIGGILTSVTINSGTAVKVVHSSAKQISVLTTGGTVINVTI